MKIRHRLMLGNLLIALFVIATVVVSSSMAKHVSKLRTVELPMEQSLREVEVGIWEAIHAADTFRVGADEAFAKIYAEELEAVDQYYAEYATLIDTPSELAAATEFERHWAKAKAFGNRLIRRSREKQQTENELFRVVNATDSVIDYQIQTVLAEHGTDALALEQSMREVEVGIWEMIHAAVQFTSIASELTDGPDDLQSYDALMERKIQEVEKFWKKYIEQHDPQRTLESTRRFERLWKQSVAQGRQLVRLEITCRQLYDTLYLAVDRSDSVIDDKLQAAIQDRVRKRDKAAAISKFAVYGVGIMAVLAALLVGHLVGRSIWQPMSELSYALSIIASGHIGHQINSTRSDELGQFARSFDDMAKQLETSMARNELAKHAAQAANRSKSEFLANMSHEIRTPLTAILGYTDVLRDEQITENAPPERLQTIDTIKHAGEHLLTVINDILDLSKIEAGKMTVELVETPLAKLLIDVDDLMRPRAEGKGVGLRTTLQTPIPDRIMSDPTRLRQILMNIVGNSTKFTEQGEIQIRVATTGPKGSQRLRFEMQDTGSGMTDAQAANLFRPFTQADSSITRKHGGTGLGLTICRRLAELMGGTVRLDYTEPGKGSRFVVDFPLTEATGVSLVEDLSKYREQMADKAAEAELKKSDNPLSGRILLAEDGIVNQRLVSFQLKKNGAHVDVADNGLIALEKIKAAEAAGNPYDLLVTDIQMPEMDGYTLATTLRDNGSAMPIIALTAHAMAEDRQKCLDAGCDDYACKPIDWPALISTCAKWLEQSNTTDNAQNAA